MSSEVPSFGRYARADIAADLAYPDLCVVVNGPIPSIVVSSLPHLVIVELALDIARKIFQSATQHIEVLTEVLDPQPVRLGVMAPD